MSVVITEVEIENFRSIRRAIVPLNYLSVLVGTNIPVNQMFSVPSTSSSMARRERESHSILRLITTCKIDRIDGREK